MLAMAAFKLGDPMSLVVLMKSDDTFQHVLNEPLSSVVAIPSRVKSTRLKRGNWLMRIDRNTDCWRVAHQKRG
jgi:hypothetical protein